MVAHALDGSGSLRFLDRVASGGAGPCHCTVDAAGHFVGNTRALTHDELANASFVVAAIANANGSAALRDVTQTAVYSNDGTTHAR